MVTRDLGKSLSGSVAGFCQTWEYLWWDLCRGGLWKLCGNTLGRSIFLLIRGRAGADCAVRSGQRVSRFLQGLGESLYDYFVSLESIAAVIFSLIAPAPLKMAKFVAGKLWKWLKILLGD